jgi:hypothetical protein
MNSAVQSISTGNPVPHPLQPKAKRQINLQIPMRMRMIRMTINSRQAVPKTNNVLLAVIL